MHAAGQPDTLTATLCFPVCADTKGWVYLLDVLVADNGCSLPKRDTVRVAFIAVPPPSTVPVLTTSFPLPASPTDTAAVLVRVALNQPYTATLLGTDPAPNPLTLTATGLGFSLATSPNGLRVGFALAQGGSLCTPKKTRKAAASPRAAPATPPPWSSTSAKPPAAAWP